MIKLKLFKFLCFGYPMNFQYYLFTDKVSGKPVNVYECKNKLYMANSRWSTFRVKYNEPRTNKAR